VRHLWFDQALLPQGWQSGVLLAVADGIITHIEIDTPLPKGAERHAIALPGLGNVHSHSFQRGMAGLAERRGPDEDTFWTWREVMYQFLDRLDPDDVEAIAALAFAEMLESGFTRVGEFHYLHHDPAGRRYANPAELAERIAAAASTTGIGLTMLPVFYAHGGFGGAVPSQGQRRLVCNIDSFANLLEGTRRAVSPLPDAVVGVAPHSLRAVTPDELNVVSAMASAGPIHIHAAEQVREVEDSVAWSGQRPVEWLLDHADIDTRWTLIHATHVTESETRALAASGAVAGLCPMTEANLGDGIFPAASFVASGGRFAVGSDSNIVIDAGRELELLEYAQRLAHRQRNVVNPGEGSTGAGLFRMALEGGAQALGAGAEGIRVGQPADIVGLNPDHPSLIQRSGDVLIDGWVFAGGAAAVDKVWRRGELVVDRGQHLRKGSILSRYRATMKKLLGK
jgi:formimidoylglutamate deiminase